LTDGISDAVALVRRLDGLPLALVIAGSYIRSTTITKYLELYNNSWNDLHETLGIRRDYPQRTIVTTWMISYNELKRKDAFAIKLLQLWGYLDNQDLWFQLLKWPYYRAQAPEWLRQITDTEIAFLKTIQNLLSYSLIEQKESSDSYSMHAVVHDWIREFINREGNNLFQIGVVSVGLAVPGEERKDYQTIQRRLLPHANRLSQSLYKKHVLGSRPNEIYDTSYLHGLHNLGALYRDQGKLDEAEAMYQRSLAGKEKALGPEHTSTLDTVNNLGVLYQDQGKLDKAEAMYQRVLAGKEKALGPEHTSTLRTVNNLGILYWDQGKLDEAEAMHQRAPAGYEKALGPEHPSTLRIFNNLGDLHRDQGRINEAEAMSQRV
jgi:tetratricopeptide (TPR) repeat protein